MPGLIIGHYDFRLGIAAEKSGKILRRFLAGKEAGVAMLESRLEMLGRLNPLGIAYTLYAFNNLTITQAVIKPQA